jgi:sec-independent protein translocase protein TatA
MFGSLGLTELLIILAVVVLLFGARRIPEIGKALGQTVANFRKGIGGDTPTPDLRQGSGRTESPPQIESGQRRNLEQSQRPSKVREDE